MCSFLSFDRKQAMQNVWFLTGFATTAKCTCMIVQMLLHIGMDIQDIHKTKTWNERRRVEIQPGAKFWVLKKNIRVIYMCNKIQYNSSKLKKKQSTQSSKCKKTLKKVKNTMC